MSSNDEFECTCGARINGSGASYDTDGIYDGYVLVSVTVACPKCGRRLRFMQTYDHRPELDEVEEMSGPFDGRYASYGRSYEENVLAIYSDDRNTLHAVMAYDGDDTAWIAVGYDLSDGSWRKETGRMDEKGVRAYAKGMQRRVYNADSWEAVFGRQTKKQAPKKTASGNRKLAGSGNARRSANAKKKASSNRRRRRWRRRRPPGRRASNGTARWAATTRTSGPRIRSGGPASSVPGGPTGTR